MHPVARACMPVSRCELPFAVLSENETCRFAHEDLQTKDERRLSNLQAAHCVVLLPREALLRWKQMPGAFLPEHQAEAEESGTPAKVCDAINRIFSRFAMLTYYITYNRIAEL